MSNITIKINTDNAVFEENPAELKKILNKALKIVQSGRGCGKLMDSNGNTVGNIIIEDS
tara:strand:+ start:196 stop:372 length:177 start_codon:yes stop_codon:yes gene_type:complete